MATKKWLPIAEGVAIIALILGLFVKGNTDQKIITEKENEIQVIQTQMDEKEAEIATTLGEKEAEFTAALEEKEAELTKVKETAESEKADLIAEKEALTAEKNELQASLQKEEEEPETEAKEEEKDASEHEKLLAEKDSQLADKDSQLADKDSQLADKDSQLADKESQLAAKDQEFAEKEAEYQKQAEELQKKLETLLSVRANMIEKLQESFDSTDLAIEIDEETGVVSLDTSVLFGFDNSDLTKEGRALLDEFIPKYFDAIFSEDVNGYVEEVILEGHTDDEGSYLYNLFMSQKRAYSVANYFLDEDNTLLTEEEREALGRILTVNGRSYSDPVLDEKGEVDAEASRRVELKFRMISDELLAVED